MRTVLRQCSLRCSYTLDLGSEHEEDRVSSPNTLRPRALPIGTPSSGQHHGAS